MVHYPVNKKCCICLDELQMVINNMYTSKNIFCGIAKPTKNRNKIISYSNNIYNINSCDKCNLVYIIKNQCLEKIQNQKIKLLKDKILSIYKIENVGKLGIQ